MYMETTIKRPRNYASYANKIIPAQVCFHLLLFSLSPRVFLNQAAEILQVSITQSHSVSVVHALVIDPIKTGKTKAIVIVLEI